MGQYLCCVGSMPPGLLAVRTAWAATAFEPPDGGRDEGGAAGGG
jgi:hypothetical protein